MSTYSVINSIVHRNVIPMGWDGMGQHTFVFPIRNSVEIDGATSYLILLLYFVLDYQLYKVIINIDKETSSSMVKKYCQNFHNIIEEKLWPYCGSSLAATAAFVTGVDITFPCLVVLASSSKVQSYLY